MSDIHWRFHECGFHNLMNLTKVTLKANKFIRKEYLLKTQQKDIDGDCHEQDINTVPVYCAVLFSGSFLAIFAFIVEIS